MPHWRAFFRTAAEAQAGADAAIARLTTAFSAGASEAGDITASSTPTTTTSTLSVTALASQALPSTAPSYSDVSWRVTTQNGASELATSRMPTAQAPTSVAATATVTITSDNSSKPTLKAKASAASKVQIYVLDATATIAANTVLEDPSTGKQYKTVGSFSASAIGYTSLSVTQVDTTHYAPVTHGTPLQFTTPDVKYLAMATVLRMKATTISVGATLTDAATGIQYTVTDNASLAGTADAISGDDTVDVFFAGPTAGANAVAVGTVLTFDSPINGVVTTAAVTASPTFTLAAGSTLTFGSNSYTTTEAATVGDAKATSVSIVAISRGASSNLTVGDTPTISAPATGMSSSATVTAVSPALAFPQPYEKQLVGAPWTLHSRVKRELDGRWCGTVYTEPSGT